jgi:hypothetical protein
MIPTLLQLLYELGIAPESADATHLNRRVMNFVSSPQQQPMITPPSSTKSCVCSTVGGINCTNRCGCRKRGEVCSSQCKCFPRCNFSTISSSVSCVCSISMKCGFQCACKLANVPCSTRCVCKASCCK